MGTGRNLEYYPEAIRLTGIDISPPMLDIARQRASMLGRDVDLRVGDAQALEFADESFDSVVFTLGLCSIPDDRKALREAKRVLRPDGRLLLLEHVASPRWPVRAVQRLLDSITVRTVADHLVRDPLVHVKELGFKIDRVERLKDRLLARQAELSAVNQQRLEQEKSKVDRLYDYRTRAAAEKLVAMGATLERIRNSPDPEVQRIIPIWSKNVENARRTVQTVESDRVRRLAELEGTANVTAKQDLLTASYVQIVPAVVL